MPAPDPPLAAGAPFDAAADAYDAFEALPGVPRLRTIVHDVLLRSFPRGARLLELNCGTGTDAAALAREGRSVLATDASARMVERTADRAAAEGLQGSLTTRTLPFERLAELSPAVFDGAWSDMGGLNCTADLRGLFTDLHPLLAPGGLFVAVVMPDLSLWETASFLARGDVSGAFRRRRPGGVDARIPGGRVHVWYHSPARLREAAAPRFTVAAQLGLNVFSPPPGAAKRLGRLRGVLEGLDDRLAAIPAFARLGDHLLVVFRRVP